MTVYGTAVRARSLAGAPQTTNVSDAIVGEALDYGTSMVMTFSGKSSWSTSDVEWAAIATASEYFASSYIRSRFQDDGDKAQKHYDMGMQLCDKIRMGSQVLIATPNYKSHPLNEDATPYSSMSGSNNSVDDSDL